jgi:phosphotransferase system enzyme I (PtsP)
MPERPETERRKLLRRPRDTLAKRGPGQERLDRITHLIAGSIGTEVCSICLLRDPETQEPCATEGQKPSAVHKTRRSWPGVSQAA